MIPLSPGAELSSEALSDDLAERWPEFGEAEVEHDRGGQITITFAEGSTILGLMPAPIPWGDLEGPCATSWLWPDAESDLRGHDQHLIVTVMSEGTPADRAGMLTKVCASILSVCDEAPGVYWCPASLLIPSPVFRQFAEEILPDGPPVHIWIDARVGPTEAGGSRGFTTGLAEFGLMELVADASPEAPGDLHERLYNLAAYLIQNGPVIRDGDSIGNDADEKIRVVYSPSSFGHVGQVMRLQWGTAPRKKGWFGR
jgi:hypothetical protein